MIDTYPDLLLALLSLWGVIVFFLFSFARKQKDSLRRIERLEKKQVE